MTMIVPAGNNSVNWLPPKKKIQKTASDGKISEEVEVDSRESLYEAAKGVVESMGKDIGNEEMEGLEVSDSESTDVIKPSEEVSEIDDETEEVEIEEVSEVGNDLEDVEDVGEEAEEISIEVVEEAVEKVDEAVGELKDTVDMAEDVIEKEEEVSEEIDAPIEVEVDIEEETPEDEGEIIVESEPEDNLDSEVLEEDVALDKSASAEEFCKFAKLSPKNREKLRSYWVNALNYPKDYVDLLVKDYEK